MSDWKQDAARRRDARHRGPVPHVRAATGKNTKRWCRGKVGVEHKTECRDYYDTKRWGIGTTVRNWKLLVCTVCGKELDTWLGGRKNKPAWATQPSSTPKEG